MGAKMMPMAKKSGSTVLGVRIGLSRSERDEATGWADGAGHSLPGLEALLSESSVCILHQRQIDGHG
jgi:hypothetical protein